MSDEIEPDPRDHRGQGLGSRGQTIGMAAGAKIALLLFAVLFGALALLSTVLKGT